MRPIRDDVLPFLTLGSLAVLVAPGPATAGSADAVGPAPAAPVQDTVLSHSVTRFLDVEVDLPEEGPAERVKGALELRNRFEERFDVTVRYPSLRAEGDVVEPEREGASVVIEPGERERVPISLRLPGEGKKRVILELAVSTLDGIPLGDQKVGLYFRVEDGRYRRATYEELYVPEREPQVVAPETDSTELLEAIVVPTTAPPAGVVEPLPGPDRLVPGEESDGQLRPAGPGFETSEGGDPEALPETTPRLDPVPDRTPDAGADGERPRGGPSPSTTSGDRREGVGASGRGGPAALATRASGGSARVGGADRAAEYTVEGEFSYKGLDDAWHPAWAWKALLYVEVPAGGNLKLAETYIEPDGTWSVTFSLPFYQGQNLQVFYTPASHYVVMEQRNSGYLFADPLRRDIDTNLDVGHRGVDLSSSGQYAGLGDVYRSAMDMWNEFERHDLDAERGSPITIFFPNTWNNCSGNSPWSCASTGGDVWLIASHTDPDVVHHELAHQMNYEYWNNDLPQGAGGSHTVNRCYNPGLAITEGFANAVPPWVQHGAGTSDPAPDGGMDVEDVPACTCPGSTNEHHVAAFFWDLLDSHADGLDRIRNDNPVAVFGTYLSAGVTGDVLDLRSDYRSGASSGAQSAIDDVYAQSEVHLIKGPGTSHTAVIDGSGSSGRTSYAIKVQGSLQQVDGTVQGTAVTENGSDNTSDNAGRGWVGAGKDGFRITGDIPEITLCDPSAADVYVDGEEYHTLVVDGRDVPGATDYSVEAGSALDIVHGNLQKRSVSVNSSDNVSGTTANGRVGSGADGYLVVGPLLELSMSDPLVATAYVDGEEYHTVIVDGRGMPGGTDYTLEDGGDLEQVGSTLQGVNVSVQSSDDVSGSRATGAVGGGVDGFRVHGPLPSVSLENPGAAEVLVDGRPYHSLVIDGRSRSGRTDYSIEGGGRLRQVDGTVGGVAVSRNAGDDVDGRRATGRVGSGADGFHVVGDVPSVDLDDPSAAELYLDGQRAHTLVVESDDVSGATEYTVEVSGGLEQVSGALHGRSVSVQSGDRVDGGSATGRVGGGTDGFLFTGELTSVDMDVPSNAEVYVDGKEAHTVVITGRGHGGSTDYTLEVTGRLRQAGGSLYGRDVSVQSSDDVSGRRATGAVSTGADGFWYTGRVENLELESCGAADVIYDGFEPLELPGRMSRCELERRLEEQRGLEELPDPGAVDSLIPPR